MFIDSLWKNEDGQGVIEYAFILSFIALSVVLVLSSLGTSVAAKFQSFADELN
ncbi:MAG: Flp family type IVb pilin [Peptococcales bacterium]|jgi:Flp pilus assembly pilin Flp